MKWVCPHSIRNREEKKKRINTSWKGVGGQGKRSQKRLGNAVIESKTEAEKENLRKVVGSKEPIPGILQNESWAGWREAQKGGNLSTRRGWTSFHCKKSENLSGDSGAICFSAK